MDGRIKRERKIENVSADHGNSTGLIFREKSGLKSVLYLDVYIPMREPILHGHLAPVSRKVSTTFTETAPLRYQLQYYPPQYLGYSIPFSARIFSS